MATDSAAASSTMKAIEAASWGDSSVLSLTDSRPRPTLAQAKAGGKGCLLLRVLACSLSPGDYRMLTGDASMIKKPKNGFPYVPGGDVCGVVQQVGEGVTGFQVGDEVVATWDVFGEGGLAEYAVVQARLAAPKPPAVSAVDGAALANSAAHAVAAVAQARVSPGDRVMVLGGAGGVGTAAVQLAKAAGAAFVAATSTAEKLVLSLGADRVVDYTRADWTADAEFRAAPFDVVIDCAVGVAAWRAACRAKVLSSSGRWVAVVLNEWRIFATGPLGLVGALGAPLLRQSKKFLWPLGPRYDMFLGGVAGKDVADVLRRAAAGELRAVVDARGPFAFTTDGVRAAWALHESRHAHGKVVIKVAE